jgi:serine/threonine protein kinase
MKISEKDMKHEYDIMIKAFDSPYLVKIIKDSYIEHKKYYCFVMEYYQNGSLRNLIDKFRKNQKNEHINNTYELIFNLSKDIINGLDYLHSDKIKIIHRDLKPENILLNEKNEIKIADFGISKIIHNHDSTMTANQGTKNYMSPEIINSKEYNFKTDVWSAGCVIFELIFLKVFKLIENSFEANIPERLSQLIRRFVFNYNNNY